MAEFLPVTDPMDSRDLRRLSEHRDLNMRDIVLVISKLEDKIRTLEGK